MLRYLQKELINNKSAFGFLSLRRYSSISQVISAKDKPDFNLRDFYKNINILKLENIHDVKKLATFVR